MIDFDLSEEQRLLEQSVREWGAREIAPRIRELDRQHRFDPAIVPKTGTTLVRQWRGRAHTVFVREDGFEYEGERYRSLTVIAQRITGAHWSGPRFFGLTKQAGASVRAKVSR